MYKKVTLNNGLRIATKHIPHLNSVALGVWIAVGSRFENKRISGISHFLEHMVFKGTRSRSGDVIKRSIEGLGGTLNGFTGEECTCYWVKVLGKHQTAALEVLADMVLDPKLDASDIEKERIVILEEIKMYKDLPNHYVHELLEEILWPGQPLSMPITGDPKSVSSMGRNDLATFRKRCYRPHNVIVTAVGNVDEAEIIASVSDIFGAASRGKSLRYKSVDLANIAHQVKFHFKETEQTHLVMGMYGLPKFDPQRYSAGLVNIILGANMSSRLFTEVREKRGLAYEIVSHVKEYHDTGLFTISAGVDNKRVQTAVEVILREVGKLKESRVKRAELIRAKEFFRGQFMMMLEETLHHMVWLGDKVLGRDELPDPEEILRKVEAVTADDIRNLARRLFKKNRLKIAFIGPLDDAKQARIRKAADLL
jgi:predicted Zn-dependent peptidase